MMASDSNMKLDNFRIAEGAGRETSRVFAARQTKPEWLDIYRVVDTNNPDVYLEVWPELEWYAKFQFIMYVEDEVYLPSGHPYHLDRGVGFVSPPADASYLENDQLIISGVEEDVRTPVSGDYYSSYSMSRRRHGGSYIIRLRDRNDQNNYVGLFAQFMQAWLVLGKARDPRLKAETINGFAFSSKAQSAMKSGELFAEYTPEVPPVPIPLSKPGIEKIVCGGNKFETARRIQLEGMCIKLQPWERYRIISHNDPGYWLECIKTSRDNIQGQFVLQKDGKRIGFRIGHYSQGDPAWEAYAEAKRNGQWIGRHYPLEEAGIEIEKPSTSPLVGPYDFASVEEMDQAIDDFIYLFTAQPEGVAIAATPDEYHRMPTLQIDLSDELKRRLAEGNLTGRRARERFT